MLEIKNVSKTYRPKKGVPVRALDDVSVSFGDKGLVFILGKSGSGKSTLLNVVGGLDKADGGEFIIKGKSSKGFKGKDFDSYRNTFIGFIFQEYNILNEFNVGQNIALAMELQGKKATSENLNKILDEVDLSGYAGRKPNELSGGQKQRVAIARALIKEPEIIMADEPTGALDSNTGKQVFDTLKKLSKTKLVLVVSHDREFAEFYGDRVIELADGKIVSDIVKYAAPTEEKSEGVSVVDGDILHIKEGYQLTEKDLGFINDYLKEHRGETIISSDKRANDGLKRAAMIDQTGAKESFKDTSATSATELGIKGYNAADTKFVRSKMPFSKAFKIGASGLKTKPVRLFFTILLSFVALAMFGIADCLAAYNKVDNTALTLASSDLYTVSFKKTYDYNNYGSSGSAMTDSQLSQLKKETHLDFKPVFKPTSNNYSFEKPNLLSSNALGMDRGSYYSSQLFGTFELSQKDVAAYGLTLIDGRLPAADNEIAIPKYIFECYKKAGYSFGSVNIKKEELTADDSAETGIIGKTLEFSNNGSMVPAFEGKYTVTGIVDTKLSESYDELKAEAENESGSFDIDSYMKYQRFNAALESGLHNLLFVNDGFVARMIAKINSEKNYPGYKFEGSGLYWEYQSNRGNESQSIYHIVKLSDVLPSNIVWTNGEKTALSKDEAVISVEILQYLTENYMQQNSATFTEDVTYYEYNQKVEKTVEISQQNSYEIRSVFPKIAAYLEIKANGVPAQFLEDYKTEIANAYTTYSYLGLSEDEFKESYYSDYLTRTSYYDDTKPSGNYTNSYGTCGDALYGKYLFNFLTEKGIYEDVVPTFKYDRRYETNGKGLVEVYNTVKVVGIYSINLDRSQSSNYSAIVSDSVYAEKAVEVGYYSMAIAPMPTGSALKKLVEYHYNIEENNTGFVMNNEVISSFNQVNSMVESLSKVFIYIGIGFAVFSALLLSNFIAVSISNKKREIGILRAVGAKSSDVFAIFFNESFLIAMINLVLGTVGTVVASIFLNQTIISYIGIGVLNFGIRQIALMFAISVGVAAIASFLPVYFIAKKRPIEAIRGR